MKKKSKILTNFVGLFLVSVSGQALANMNLESTFPINSPFYIEDSSPPDESIHEFRVDVSSGDFLHQYFIDIDETRYLKIKSNQWFWQMGDTTVLNIEGFSYETVKLTPSIDPVTLTAITTTEKVDLSEPVTPGRYRFEVSGDAVGNGGGSYFVKTFVSPVPEAEVWAMMIAGIGFLSWRLKKMNATTVKV